MIMYDYICDICGKALEQDRNEYPPLCCGEYMRHKWAVGGIAFRGAGFYVNDYKDKTQ